MKNNGTRILTIGVILLFLFALWTALIQTVDVQPVGQNETDIGFAGLNVWFHEATGVHMNIYIITDWLGLVPVFICMVFGVVGLVQLIKTRSLLKVDKDIKIKAETNIEISTEEELRALSDGRSLPQKITAPDPPYLFGAPRFAALFFSKTEPFLDFSTNCDIITLL